LQRLLDVLQSDRQLLGPRVVDGVIGLAPIASVDDLPQGWHDEQGPGRYRLDHSGDRTRFGWAVGPLTSKPVIHPAEAPVWTVRRTDHGFDVQMASHPVRRLALFGLRPCEVAAIAKLDRVLVDGAHTDPAAAATRAECIVVAVECARPAATCFCASMGSGPGCASGADVVLTELDDPVRYVAVARSSRGRGLLDAVAAPPARAGDLDLAARTTAEAAQLQVRHVDGDGIAAVLRDTAESGEWDAVAARCLACGNCTSVCPTCFCTDVVDTTTLAGDEATRVRRWDSCFSLQFSRIAGHSVRSSVRARYRQWCTHKLGTWWDQFGESGCVGCGRCITWCPVGIDITAHAAALAEEVAR
jgi:ferredoxin